MADLRYTVAIDTKQAEGALNNLNKSIDGLRGALASLAIGTFIANTYKSAMAVNDLAEQTNFSVQAILGLNRAFQENGSDANTAQEAISRFTKNVGEAAAGSANLQQSFAEVGVTLQDLSTLSEQDLFLKVIKGLGNISDKATQARLAADLLGKSAKANFAGIAGSVDQYIAGSAAAAQANINANKAAENFERAITNLKEQLLIVLDPISKLASNINVAGEKIGKFLEIVKNVAIVAGAFFVVTRAIRFVIAAFEGLMTIIAGFGRGLALIKKTWEIFIWQLGKIKQAGGLASESFEGFAKRLKFMKAGIDLVVKAIGVLVAGLTAIATFIIPDSVSNAFKKLGEMLGFSASETDKLADKKKKLDETLANNEAMLAELEAQRQVIDALKEKVKAIEEVGNAYARNNREIINNINNEAKYLTMTERDAEVQKALDDLYTRTAATIQDLQNQKAKLTDKDKEQKKAIDETIASINNQARADANRIKTAIENLQAEREAIDARNRAIEFGEQLRQDTASLEAMQAEIDMLYMNSEAREDYKNKLDAERNLKERLAAIDKEAATVGKNATASQLADFDARRQAAIAFYDAVIEKQSQYNTALDDEARKIKVWGEETKKALEDSISPSSQVKTFWDGLSGQIDNFARTGKFKVKEFLAGIIQDFIAAKIKLAALNFLNVLGLGGGGGLLGGKIIPGFLAEGGPAQKNKPYIVGEQGPELFVPNTSGKVVPNDKLSQGTSAQVNAPIQNTYITNNINAIDAKSVAQLFMENRKTLFGSVQMAQREMPYAAR